MRRGPALAVTALIALCAGVASAQPEATSDGRVAYVNGLTNDIWVVDADGRNSRRLHRPRTEPADLAWSPGGKWLLHSATSGGLWIVRADGRESRRIAPFASDGSWSPDGRRIVFLGRSTRAGCTDVYAMRLNGSELRKLTSTRACESDPSFSPDGRHVVFRAGTDYGGSQIVVARSDGTHPVVIGEGLFPAWSPDGSTIAYATGSTLRLVRPGGGVVDELELTGPDLFGICGLAWSPTGGRFVVSQVHATGSGPIKRGGCRLYLVDENGSNRREVTVTSIESDRDPAWQPLRSG